MSDGASERALHRSGSGHLQLQLQLHHLGFRTHRISGRVTSKWCSISPIVITNCLRPATESDSMSPISSSDSSRREVVVSTYSSLLTTRTMLAANGDDASIHSQPIMSSEIQVPCRSDTE